MTVMPSSSDVADKAVSTEDASSGVEVARLEAVLAALVETKVEAMKASAATNARRAGSAPPSPRRPRFTSSSTVSSSQNQHHCHHHHHQQQQHSHHHHHHHHHHHQRQDKRGRREHGRHRRHRSAPCGDFLEDPFIAHQHKQRHGEDIIGKGKQKNAIDSPRSAKKRRRQSKSPQVLSRDLNNPTGLDSRFELLGIEADHDLSLIKFDRASREVLSDSCEDPRLHRSACYISHSTAQLKSFYDEYPSFIFADDVEEDEDTFSGPAAIFGAIASPMDSQEHEGYLHHHRPRRKRKRRKRKKRANQLVDVEGVEAEIDPDDLPPRARWTIVATACLLLAMSLLLVGVTLRMAPIIDEMGDGRRASVCKAKTRRQSIGQQQRRDSVRPIGTRSPSVLLTPTSVEADTVKDPREVERARRHRRIAMVLLGTFLFILVASVLAVVVTLTHSSFHRPPTVRKENEELLNSLNRDSSVPENATTSLPP